MKKIVILLLLLTTSETFCMEHPELTKPSPLPERDEKQKSPIFISLNEHISRLRQLKKEIKKGTEKLINRKHFNNQCDRIADFARNHQYPEIAKQFREIKFAEKI
jgi:hypothetical protein